MKDFNVGDRVVAPFTASWYDPAKISREGMNNPKYLRFEVME